MVESVNWYITLYLLLITDQQAEVVVHLDVIDQEVKAKGRLCFVYTVDKKSRWWFYYADYSFLAKHSQVQCYGSLIKRHFCWLKQLHVLSFKSICTLIVMIYNWS